MIAVYPGSFDPVTLGHLDIISRSAKIVDKLVVGILINSMKQPMFTMEERLMMLRETVSGLDNVEVQTFEGMTIDFARRNNAKVIIRGLRVISDYETEMQIAQVNRSIDPSIETMFLSTGLEYSFLSSTIAKEVAYYDAGVEKLVPPVVAKKFKEKFFK
ncbi:MAG: pantetheine-phosphate adenylyltransferase [Butyrivibrio sp.]